MKSLNIFLSILVLMTSNLASAALVADSETRHNFDVSDSDGDYAATFRLSKELFKLVWFNADGQVLFSGEVGPSYLIGAIGDTAVLRSLKESKVTLVKKTGESKAFKVVDSDLSLPGFFPDRNGFIIKAGVYRPDNKNKMIERGDAVLTKVDSEGNIVWSQEYVCTSCSQGGLGLLHILPLKNGKYLAYFADILDDVLMLLDSNGNIEWERTFGSLIGDPSFEVSRLAETSDGRYLVTGHIIDWRTDPKTQYKLRHEHPAVIWINPDGGIAWAKKFYPSGSAGPVACSADKCKIGIYLDDFDATEVITVSNNGEILEARTFPKVFAGTRVLNGRYALSGYHPETLKPMLVTLDEGDITKVVAEDVMPASAFGVDTLTTPYVTRPIIVPADPQIRSSSASFYTQTLYEPLSGWWYDPQHPGTGLAIESRKGSLFSAYFFYNENGKPTWLTSANYWSSGAFVGDLLSWTGSPWNANYYAPTASTMGTSSISVTDFLNFSISSANANFTQQMIRFMPDFAGPETDPRGPAGWWWDPDHEGMGFFLEIRNEKLALVWYFYNESALPVWRVVSGDFPLTSEIFTGTFLEFRNGQCLGCKYKKPEMIDTGMSVTIDFSKGLIQIENKEFKFRRFRF